MVTAYRVAFVSAGIAFAAMTTGCVINSASGSPDGGTPDGGSAEAGVATTCSYGTGGICACSAFEGDGGQSHGPPCPGALAGASTGTIGLCCAEPGYPKEVGTHCGCVPVGCNDLPEDGGGGGCSCYRGAGTPSDGVSKPVSACPSAYTHCCAEVVDDAGTIDMCMCSDQPCLAGWASVPSCSPETIGCGLVATGPVKVSSCE